MAVDKGIRLSQAELGLRHSRENDNCALAVTSKVVKHSDVLSACCCLSIGTGVSPVCVSV